MQGDFFAGDSIPQRYYIYIVLCGAISVLCFVTSAIIPILSQIGTVSLICGLIIFYLYISPVFSFSNIQITLYPKFYSVRHGVSELGAFNYDDIRKYIVEKSRFNYYIVKIKMDNEKIFGLIFRTKDKTYLFIDILTQNILKLGLEVKKIVPKKKGSTLVSYIVEKKKDNLGIPDNSGINPF